MAQVLVRDLDPSVVSKLKERARLKNRSLQAELKTVLAQAAQEQPGDFQSLAARIRKKLARRTHSDSAILLAEDRAR